MTNNIPGIVIIPTYNECENIVPLVREILSQPANLDILVVDDNSPDGTGEIAEDLAKSSSQRVQVLHRESKLGLGTAYQEGFIYALKSGADYKYIVSLDADFSHSPQKIPVLVDKVLNESYDLALGSRYVDGGGTVGCGLWRRFVSKGANSFATRMLGFSTSDNTGSFRCFKREVIEKLLEPPPFSSGYAFLIEVVYRCQRMGFRITEIPIVYVNRREGASKISKREIVKAIYTVFRLRWQKLPWDRWLRLYHRFQGQHR